MAQQFNFKVGDLVRKRTGKIIGEIISINERYSYSYRGKYCYCKKITGKGHFNSYESDLVIVNEDEVSMEKTKTLYSLILDDGSTGYGVHVGTNSENKYLLEVKGTGNIVVRSKSEIEEILPYTISLSINGSDVHYISEPGKLNKGDYVIYNLNGKNIEVAKVSGVDTKNKTARSKFKGLKLVTEEV
jgi:hypothetical protein